MHKFDFIMNDDHGCVCVADPLQMVHVNCPDYVTFIFPRNWEQILRVAAAIAQCFIGFTFCQFPFCVLCVCVCVFWSLLWLPSLCLQNGAVEDVRNVVLV